MRFLALILLPLSIISWAERPSLPNSSTRVQILKTMASQMSRIDGEALQVRKNRPHDWKQIVSQLENEIRESNSWSLFIRSLLRLNQTFPNLHSQARLGPQYGKLLPHAITPRMEIIPEWTSPQKVIYRVSSGAQIIAINGRSMNDWQWENFEFCKFPLKAQCDFNFPVNFQRELLSWTRDQNLTFTFKNGSDVWTTPVGLKRLNSSPFHQPIRFLYCKYHKNRYSGFTQVYSGNRACVYQSSIHPEVAVLRITSFSYNPDELEAGEKIDSLQNEIEALYPWWIAHASWDHLIVDVIDNHGGNAPIPYDQILLQRPFQEQYVSFKKISEMEDKSLRMKGLFWESIGQEIWFQNLMNSGVWDQIPLGGFTPPVPMFCPDQNKDCSEGLFDVRPHPFHGNISLLVNQWCVSSCDGFVFNLVDKLGADVFGQPQAADTAYSRLTLNFSLDTQSQKGFRFHVGTLEDNSDPDAFIIQSIVATRSVTPAGRFVDGKPAPLKSFVPITLKNRDRWPNEVLQTALKELLEKGSK